MNDRRRRDRALPEALTDDDLPTEEHTALGSPGALLTDDDIEDSIQTVERRLPTGLFDQKLPSFDGTRF